MSEYPTAQGSREEVRDTTECPSCWAQPGSNCQGVRRERASNHAARVAAFWRQYAGLDRVS